MTITEIVAKKLRLFSKRKVVNILDGNYDSIFKGRGLEFKSLRNYVVGDDVKDIDWRATARTKETQTRLYSPLRDQRIVIVSDTTPSMLLQSHNGLQKRDVLYGVVATLGMFVIKNKDLLAICSSQPDGSISISRFVNSKNRVENNMRQLDDTIKLTPPQKQHTLTELLDHVLNSLKHKSAIFIITDSFLDPAQLKKRLIKLSKRHQLFMIQISPSWPFTDALNEDESLTDIETDEEVLPELTVSKQLQQEWLDYAQNAIHETKLQCDSTGTAFVEIKSTEDVTEELRRLFMQARRYARRR